LVRFNFQDYDRANPATEEIALEKYAKERQGVSSFVGIST
jgi:hypothetical protein